jgi:hypothetical protein
MESGRLAAEALLHDLGIFVEPDEPAGEAESKQAAQHGHADPDEDDD